MWLRITREVTQVECCVRVTAASGERSEEEVKEIVSLYILHMFLNKINFALAEFITGRNMREFNCGVSKINKNQYVTSCVHCY